MSNPQSSVDRRDFLTAGAALAGTFAASSGIYAQSSQTINVGVIGCGGRGGGAITDVLAADPDVRITALCDLHQDRVKRKLNELRKRDPKRTSATEEDCFSGLDGFKKLCAHPNVNYIILAAPPGFRPYHLEAAVAAGKHVFTEKPVAVDVAGTRKCLDLVAKSKAKNLKIAAGTQRRHQAGYIETMKRLHDGQFGDIVSGRVYWNGQTPWFNPRRKGQSDVEYQLYNWYHFVWLCGDHIVEQHVHNLDVACWAMQTLPVKATGMGGRSNRPVGKPSEVGHIFDHFAVEYEYANGVVIGSQCRQIPGCANSVSEAFVGTKGRIYTHPGTYLANGNELVNAENERNPYEQEHVDLIKAIRDNLPLNELEQVTNSTFMAILGRMATYSGKTLGWDDVLKGTKWYEDTMPKDLKMDMELAVSPVPVVGEWAPAKRG